MISVQAYKRFQFNDQIKKKNSRKYDGFWILRTPCQNWRLNSICAKEEQKCEIPSKVFETEWKKKTRKVNIHSEIVLFFSPILFWV